MSKIQIFDLHSAGSSLFSDDESYMNELDETSPEMTTLYGGCTPFTVGVLVGIGISYARARQVF